MESTGNQYYNINKNGFQNQNNDQEYYVTNNQGLNNWGGQTTNSYHKNNYKKGYKGNKNYNYNQNKSSKKFFYFKIDTFIMIHIKLKFYFIEQNYISVVDIQI